MFRYLGGEEWREYRAILKVFSGTFFAEFTPHDIAAELVPDEIDPGVVADRLESLRRWGNLTVSSSVGNPSSLEDYYRRRNRYLITRAGQEVFDLTERVLASAEQIGDVQAGRLRQLQRALRELSGHADVGFERIDAEELAATVRTAFDLHEQFTNELTQFFAQLNQWQRRYDLNPDEVQFFASVLVNYVSEQLTEISRMARPIARRLEYLHPRIEAVLPALRSGLATRVEDAGLDQRVAVRRLAGTELRHWDNLAAWFMSVNGRSSRLDQLTQQALSAVRTLTANVTRLSRLGLGAASRRADFLRLAGFFDRAATVQEAHRIAAAAFGLGSCRRIGSLAEDVDDPAPPTTAWKDAPHARVPVSLRERGETKQLGRTTPVLDRSRERRHLQQRRERERVSQEMAADELLGCTDENGSICGAELSNSAFLLLRDLIGRSSHGRTFGPDVRVATNSRIRCEIRRQADTQTVIQCPEGRLVLHDLVVTVAAMDAPTQRTRIADRALPATHGILA
ncbi:MAG: TIGR02677 family protein [Rhodospirillaceae bacterium]|nr:TIGR02677 family protein [Rhodospirillaceae bacterium]